MALETVNERVTTINTEIDRLVHASIVFFAGILSGYLYFQHLEPLAQAGMFLMAGPILAVIFVILCGGSIYSLKKHKRGVECERRFKPFIVNSSTVILCFLLFMLPPAHYMDDNHIEVIRTIASPSGTRLMITYIVDEGATGQSRKLYSVIPAAAKDCNLAHHRLPFWVGKPKWIDENTIEVHLMEGTERPSDDELNTENWFTRGIKLQIAE